MPYSEKQRPNFIGKRFGRGIVVSRVGVRNKGKSATYFWKLKCDCGKEYEANTGALNIGHVLSCGCLNKEIVKKNIKKAISERTLPYGHAARNELLARYKRDAIKKNLPFELDEELFFHLTEQPCSYCGSLSYSTWRGRNGNYNYNGIDRIDSSLGYVLDNVQPCCKRCNQAKNNMSENEFIDWVCRVYHFTSSEHVIAEKEVQYAS